MRAKGRSASVDGGGCAGRRSGAAHAAHPSATAIATTKVARGAHGLETPNTAGIVPAEEANAVPLREAVIPALLRGHGGRSYGISWAPKPGVVGRWIATWMQVGVGSPARRSIPARCDGGPCDSMGRVLAVQPAPALVARLVAIIEPGCDELEFCGGSAECIRRVRERAIDVVVTDAATPVVEDLALAAEVRQIRPAVRIIVLAPDAAPADVVEAIRAGVFACFTRPFDYDEIASMTSSALRADGSRDCIQVVSGLPHWLTLRASCHLLTADRLVRFITELQSTIPGDHDMLLTAFREMLLNAMEHGAGFDPEQVIEVTAAKTARAIVYHFRDPGAGFDPALLDHAALTSDPATVLSMAIRRAALGLRPGGFGMLIVRHVVDEVVYNERGNEVLLIKHLV